MGFSLSKYTCFSVLHYPLWVILVTLLGKAQQLQEQRHLFLSVCAVFSCIQTMMYGCQCLGFLMCTQILMHVITHRGFADTVSEFALKVDSGRKITCRSRDSNLRQFCAWLLSCNINQLSYSPPLGFAPHPSLAPLLFSQVLPRTIRRCGS